MYEILDKVNSPQDLKKLGKRELILLYREIRRFLIDNVTKTGGHLASNLGVVELTVALNLGSIEAWASFPGMWFPWQGSSLRH